MAGNTSENGVEIIECSRESSTVISHFDLEDTPASVASVATLAELLDSDPVELPSLYQSIDPDALDALFGVPEGTNGEIHVSFTHDGHTISVSGSGVVTIASTDEHTPGTRARHAEHLTSENQTPTSKQELNTDLQGLLRSASENGIDVKGGFDCRNGDGHPDYDVIVTEVERN